MFFWYKKYHFHILQHYRSKDLGHQIQMLVSGLWWQNSFFSFYSLTYFSCNLYTDPQWSPFCRDCWKRGFYPLSSASLKVSQCLSICSGIERVWRLFLIRSIECIYQINFPWYNGQTPPTHPYLGTLCTLHPLRPISIAETASMVSWIDGVRVHVVGIMTAKMWDVTRWAGEPPEGTVLLLRKYIQRLNKSFYDDYSLCW